MDEIRELMGRLGQLSEEEFAKLAELVRTEAEGINDEDPSDEITQSLVELGEATDAIVAERTARETKATESREAREAARDKIKAIAAQEDEPEESAEEPEEEETPAEEPEAEAEVEEQVAEPVAASGAVAKMARRAPKPTPSPEEAPEKQNGVLVAARGFEAGTPITTRDDLATRMSQTLQTLSKDSPHGKVIVASARFEYPEERQIGESASEFAQKVGAICGPQAQAYGRDGQPLGGSLVATGGICQPVNVDYSVPTWATADTPLVDGLDSFEATRGGVRYVVPPDIAEWEGATGVWTEATDAEPGSSTKPVKALACGTEESVLVEAISTRIAFGNMQSRFAPEQVAANTDVAMAAAARVREENLLNLIEGVSVKKLETAQELGAARDIFSNVAYAVAAYRNIHRIPATQGFTVILPAMAKELIRVDLMREQAHNNGSDMNVWEINDQMIDALFAQYRINVIWHLDGQKEPSSKNYESQYAVAAHVAEGKKIDEIFPQSAWATKGLVWYLFPVGAIQRLDAGRLDLGVVRDSTLDATNDYETFVEVFEGIAGRAFAKGVWQVLSIVKATGASSATVTPVAP